MVTLAIIGGSMTILVVLVLTLMWVSSRSEQSPEQRRLRARRDHEKSRDLATWASRRSERR